MRRGLRANGVLPRFTGVSVRKQGYCEERIARYLELAGAAQEAADRASHPSLQETYVQLASQWIELARMAERTIDLARDASRPIAGDEPQPAF